jgi:hypothetical protein
VASSLAAAPARGANDARVEVRPLAAQPARAAAPPLPPLTVYPVQLVVDDDQAEVSVGVAEGGGAKQFLWFNRFVAPVPFRLEEIWVLFPPDPELAAGAAIEIAIFDDLDGDPTSGAALRARFDATVQAADGALFSIYPLATPLAFPGGAHLMIGVVPRYIESGVTPPSFPAALDASSSSGASWLAVWAADPPSPPTLPGDLLTTPVETFEAGNWMIRGFGTAVVPFEIPTLGAAGLAALAAAVGILSVARIRRRRR